MTSAQPCSVGIVGAGNMGGSLVHGLLEAGVDAARLAVVDQRAQVLAPFAARGLTTGADLEIATTNSELVVLGVKPKGADELIPALAPYLDRSQVLVSIMAGVPTARIAALLGRPHPVVRVMPQTLVRLRAGATAVAAGAGASGEDLSRVCDLFGRLGSTVEVDEALMDAVTGLSGSGPAYVYTMIEALADGGVAAGLPRATALQLAAQTVVGAGRMVLESGMHPAALRDQVTSPAGTTAAGLSQLEAAGVRHAFMRAVEAAARRSQELGHASGSPGRRP